MPGPVPHSYHREFGPGPNAEDVRGGLQNVVDEIGARLGDGLKDIVEVAQGGAGKLSDIRFSEKELRLIRFGLLRALDSI